MFRHSEVAVNGGSQRGDPLSSGDTPRRPNLAGDLDAMLDPRPLFRSALRGYDRLQVDNYVSWVEAELLASKRENDDLLSRYGTCSAELEISRRLLASSPEGRELVRTSERVGEIMRLAADEAAQLTEAGAVEADRIRAQARAEADTLLRRAHQIKDDAITECGLMREDAQRTRDESMEDVQRADAEAAATRQGAADKATTMRQSAADEATREVDGARAAADRILATAAAERRRLAAEAQAERDREAAAVAERLAAEETRTLSELAETCAARVAEAQAQVDDLHRQRDEARAALRRLTAQLDDVVGVVSALVDAEERAGREEQVAQAGREEQLAP